MPVVLILIAATHNFWFRYCRKTTRELKDMNIDELKAIAKKKKDAIKHHRDAKRQEAARQREAQELRRGHSHISNHGSPTNGGLQRSGTMQKLTHGHTFQSLGK